MSNFWSDFKKVSGGKPILSLAPMADVTDAAFRAVISKYSQIPHVTYTEFVSADGLVRAPEAGRQKLLKDLQYLPIERPIVAQFFSSKPEMMEKAVALAVELGFDGVDINMGCPDKSIEKQGAGAALIKNPALARALIQAAKRGVADKSKELGQEEIPVSVKTRLGYNKDELEEWLPQLLAENPAAIVVHARTRKEMSKVPARWERVKRAVEIRNEIQGAPDDAALKSGRTLIMGNGDLLDVADAYRKCKESGADGAMLGRAVFGNPFIFAGRAPTIEEKLSVLIEHTKLYEEKLGGTKSFEIMKKHFKSYLSQPNGPLALRDLRFKLMRAENAAQVEAMITEYLAAGATA